MNVTHYLFGHTNYGGANGYISHFVADLDEPSKKRYISFDIEHTDVAIFHRADGLKKRFFGYLSRYSKHKKTRFVQTFHNPTLPYLETYYNNKTIANFAKIPLECVKFYLALILCDALYFASPQSISSYRDPIFLLAKQIKKVGYFPTLLSTELLPDTDFPYPKAVQKKYEFGFLGRDMRVKGADIFKALTKRHPNQRFVATWKGKSISNLEKIGRTDKWDFLSNVGAIIIPNRKCYYDLVILEALSAGVNVITTDVGGVRDINHELLFKIPEEEWSTLELDKISAYQNLDNNQKETKLEASCSEIRESFNNMIVGLFENA
ncbi:hypothetical protein N6L24_15455 [Cognatishimia sp. SS12]|uniref:hypothetical protein n=1 Tax=Cognatishimia sp. SS12 TaxID=2979465 RepID=UPI002330D6FF|nr:hypothetical protein [Cognatishimia sp. SS12]MDC0739684.1 hypothetical protein [Cognatishimia sp. SS12]